MSHPDGPRPIPNPLDPSGKHEMCSLCGCWWRLPIGEQPKDEWCAELDPDGGCQCHRQAYIDGFLDAAGKRRSPVIEAGEEVLAYIEPFSSFREDAS